MTEMVGMAWEGHQVSIPLPFVGSQAKPVFNSLLFIHQDLMGSRPYSPIQPEVPPLKIFGNNITVLCFFLWYSVIH